MRGIVVKSNGKPIFGKIYDATKRKPPHNVELLLFHDEVFAWSIGIYDRGLKRYVSKWEKPVLYWGLGPPRGLLALRVSSSADMP